MTSALLTLASTGALADTSADFNRLLADHWARAQQEKVFFRTDPDAFRPDGKLPGMDGEARDRRAAFNLDMLARLDTIDGDALRGQQRISYQLFRYERETERESYAQWDHLFPITSLFGYHMYFADALANMAFASVADYDRLIASFNDYPRYNAEQMDNLREGVRRGFTQYCGAMANYGETIARYIVDDPAASAFYEPFTRFPAAIDASQRQRLAREARQAIAEQVIPAYRAFHAFFAEQYLPACRTAPAITSVEGGDTYYRYLIRYFTTTDLSPEAIHQLGLDETRRIRAEMEATIRRTGFDGSFQDFLAHLREDPRFYAESPEDLLEKVSLIAKRMDGQMPTYFGRLPRLPYTVRKVNGRGAFYVGGTADGRNPGVYFIDADNFHSKPLYNLEALTLHEAVPGHHHQSALALELDLPPFRRTLYHAAFGEGWGLYAESLGKEAGFYRDPYSDFGRLTYEMWRANRLVVDTGLHAYGWSRQRAIDYLLSNTALTADEVTAEVDRYITWPAQALAYKVGELRIQALRRQAEQALGEDFDLRAFHDVVVGNGSLAIAILEEVVADWVASQRRGS
ncbi:DUF885 domain-containing protein [Parahaliea mediterranea]|uniref:DUF885 domain-containing protein n=1 Tax=Parahaliea mediterranea TaxID=651086 RepID=A0A939DGK0_9GAMM|nr:DUF885 domain-containing protein [Parahaliea mediterranea]MBN7797824.1 DUF885 domain-containing protein [Parahaliea mediterranea]